MQESELYKTISQAEEVSEWKSKSTYHKEIGWFDGW